MTLGSHDAVRAGLATFSAFLLVGLVPLLPYLLNWCGLLRWHVMETIPHPFLWSSVLTSVAFFWVGALKGRFVNQSWLLSGGETLGIGGVAAAMAYGVGVLLKGLAG